MVARPSWVTQVTSTSAFGEFLSRFFRHCVDPQKLLTISALGDSMLSQVPVKVAGTMILIDERTRDGSRHFTSLPQTATWEDAHDHVLLLSGAEMLNFVVDEFARAWFDFCFRRHRFLVHARDGLFRLFVRDPQCPDLILYQVGSHFEQLLREAEE